VCLAHLQAPSDGTRADSRGASKENFNNREKNSEFSQSCPKNVDFCPKFAIPQKITGNNSELTMNFLQMGWRGFS
jgi:hypothetical protein